MALFRKFNTDNKEMCLYITIKCNGRKRFRVFSRDLEKQNSFYADRVIDVDNERVIYFSFPVSPKNIIVGVVNSDNEQDTDYTFTLEEKPLKSYNIWMDEETRDFVQLAINFSQRSGFERPSPKGTVYQTDDGYFNIKYMPVIKDFASGEVLNTPARIGHNTGLIEVAEAKFNQYTIPMRICILLHEFSHKYKNPKMNLNISNEIGADINALYIYLGLGFSKIDAICVFANVFLKAQSDENIVRMRKIQDYIRKFENQEFAQLN
jgi:hypothetical protein